MKRIFWFFLFAPLFLSIVVLAKEEKAIFAAGCFWCIQPPYDKLKDQGVISTRVGYTGGKSKNPNYKEISKGNTGHIEAIEVVYDSSKITYAKLLDVFWKNVDPFDAEGQFCDKGSQYISAVFYIGEEQKKATEKSREELKKLKSFAGKEIVTKILPAAEFFAAEDEHQSYYTKNRIRYNYYRFSCKRDQRLKEVWGNL